MTEEWLTRWSDARLAVELRHARAHAWANDDARAWAELLEAEHRRRSDDPAIDCTSA